MGRDHHLKIGNVVARTGLTERAIRHYEHEDLIAPARSASGQRLYRHAFVLAHDDCCRERSTAAGSPYPGDWHVHALASDRVVLWPCLFIFRSRCNTRIRGALYLVSIP